MIKVFLREKKLKRGRRGPYPDFYPSGINPETSRRTGREHLRLDACARPKTETEKNRGKETKLPARILGRRAGLNLQAGVDGFVSMRNRQKNFLIAEGKI